MSNPILPSDRYVSELTEVLMRRGRSADHIAQQIDLLHEGPDLPWTPDQQRIIAGAQALSDRGDDKLHSLPVHWRALATYVVNIGELVLWSAKINDVQERARFCLIITHADGHYESGQCGWIPS